MFSLLWRILTWYWDMATHHLGPVYMYPVILINLFFFSVHFFNCEYTYPVKSRKYISKNLNLQVVLKNIRLGFPNICLCVNKISKQIKKISFYKNIQIQPKSLNLGVSFSLTHLYKINPLTVCLYKHYEWEWWTGNLSSFKHCTVIGCHFCNLFLLNLS